MSVYTHSPHVIAEAGTNHNGSVDTGKALVDAAVAAGADSVKFQMLFPEGLYLPRLFENGGYRDSEVFERRCATALAPEAYRELAAHCRSRGIGFSASVFDRTGIALLDELDAPYIKFASCDLNHSALLQAGAETGRRLIVSTGMATPEEIERALLDIGATGGRDVVLMHCVSVYPCPTEIANLPFLDDMRTRFGREIGLSDHTERSLAAAIAVSKGARWIEKHLTLDRAAPGFDHAYAMEPDAFAEYVRDVRAAFEACRPRAEKLTADEVSVKQRARRGLYAARDLSTGETVREADVLVVRPESALAPNDLASVVGRTTNRAIRRYEPLAWEMLERQRTEALESGSA
jgi:sialic acid synthase SpsE